MKKILALLFLITGSLQAHWFDVSREISDEALRELSTLRNFAENSNLAIYPMSKGKAIAIYIDKFPGWFTNSQAYYCLFYDGTHWGKPCKFHDCGSAENLYHISGLKINFVSNERDEAYLSIFDFSDKNYPKTLQILQLAKGVWTAPVTVSGKKFLTQIDLNGAALVKTENKIIHIKDQKIHAEELEDTKYTSDLIKDINNYLCHLTLINEATTGRSLIEEHAWDGLQWQRTPLAEIEADSLIWLALKKTQTGKLALWRLKSPENTTRSYCSFCSIDEEWSSPELIDETKQCDADGIIVCDIQDSVLCVWKKKSQLVSKRWINGYWEDTQVIAESPNIISFGMRNNSHGQAYVFWETIDYHSLFGNASVWNENAWSLPSKIFSAPLLNINMLENKRIHEIDDLGNILVAWEEQEPFSFHRNSRKIRYSTFSNNQWRSNEIEGIAGVPFLFNYKGTIVLSWMEEKGNSRFSFLLNGELSESFHSKTPQATINHYLNIGFPTPQ